MAYLGKGRREDLFVLATELNLKHDKSMTIATLKNLITGSEGYDEELTKNLHATIVEDRKSNEERIRTEEQETKITYRETNITHRGTGTKITYRGTGRKNTHRRIKDR
ncbi:hypothetical protein TNCT_120431 [Trichonephila clavata]|uniref:Uncharacterized protein n=1 Tax=Trichonephila clavata TaxID=2740835 RepID=A0A8X6M3Z5_TRICU|nr:hypothetical protein TNCT_120431 [Trichonephila clavata]